MNLAIDYGNTSAKVAIFEDRTLKQLSSFRDSDALKDFLYTTAVENVIVSSVTLPVDEIVQWTHASGKLFSLKPGLPLPVKMLYNTLDTLGTDRIAGVCGAIELAPGKDLLVIDAGSCITYDFVDHAANYHGGAISPGIQMRFKSLHTFTERLPMIQAKEDVPLTGKSTEESMLSGVMNGVFAEVKEFIRAYKQLYADLGIVICGGDALSLHKHLGESVRLYPELVLLGLNRILIHNLGH